MYTQIIIKLVEHVRLIFNKFIGVKHSVYIFKQNLTA